MNRLSNFIQFLLEKGFNEIENNNQLGFVTYELDGLFLQIEQDRNLERFISLSRANKPGFEGWYDMDIIRFLVLNTDYENVDSLHFENLSQFFMENYEEIFKAFSYPDFYNSENILATLKKQRAKALYGYDLG